MNMNKKAMSWGVVAIIIIVVAAIVTAGLFLYPYPPNQPPQADDVGSTEQGIQQIINANNQFAFELYSELSKQEDENMFYSPYSISAALAMTYEGAKGKTADEMKSVFHFPETNILRPNFAAIYNEINKGAQEYELRTGNALWLQKDYPFFEDYTSRVEKYYGGKAANLDFVGETEQSRQTINSFIEEQTNNKIKDLIPAGMLSSMTRLVLTNAIYFKGTWEWEFDESDTREQNFQITPYDVPFKVPMMFMDPDKARFNYADTEDLQILELPYKGEDISMLILLPKETLDEISLTAEKLQEYRNQIEETKLDAIYLPKFEFDTKYSMNNALSALGMPTAFNPEQADFSGMANVEQLYINFVIHQAYVKVDEKGTEAAAATAVGMSDTSAGPETVFRADHPFIFIIQQRDTGNILFIGRVVDPR